MPEPQSRRGNVITEAAFQAPFTTPVHTYGMGGLDLAHAVDQIPLNAYSRLSNLYWTPKQPGQATARPGLTPLVTAGTQHHSMLPLWNPLTSVLTSVWGVDTDVYLGASGALGAPVDSGYSGDPLTLLPHRPPLSGDPWAYIGDRTRMRKVRADGLVTPIGLPAPGAAITLGLAAEHQTVIADFAGADAAPNWTPNAGIYSSTEGNPTFPTHVPQTAAPGTFIFDPLTVTVREATSAYVFWGLAKTLDLSKVGAVDAADEDLIHFILTFSHPWFVQEVRIYFVVSDVFSASLVPGTVTASNPANRDFYMKSFRAGDFSPFLAADIPQAEQAEISRVHEIRQQALRRLSDETGAAAARTKAIIRSSDAWLAQYDPYRAQSAKAGASAQEQVEFGRVGNPLRRGDFQRFGATAGRDWSTVTGLILLLRVEPFLGSQINLTLDEWYLTGGAGPDSTEPGAQSYDMRYTHYDPRTGAEGNPSPEMAEADFVDAARRGLVGTPVAYGDAAIRQRFYRRGGSLVDDWYFAGTNTADGAAFTDTETDLGLAAAGTLELDHYQPVPTVDANGATVLAQPVPILFGPVNGQLFAVGDPYRAGFVYASKPDEPDHWPPDLAHEVCAPSEELMTGVVYGGQPYVFSRERLYPLYPNLTGAAGLTSSPSTCTRGTIGRWAVTTGAGFMWFVAADGVFKTAGGAETRVSDDLQPLFEGTAVRGRLPIDLTAATSLRLAFFNDELWFGYQDTNGDYQVFICHALTGQWRAYDFATPVNLFVANGVDDDNVLVLGGVTSGASYTHAGTSDDGAAIAVLARTGALDFGRPREEKLFGDQILDLDALGVAITLQNFLNLETVTNAVQTLTGSTGNARTIWDSFYGSINGPQRARNIATEVGWSTDQAPPTLYRLGTSVTAQPDLTVNRVTNWDDLGHADEAYCMGVTLDADTGGVDRTIIIERDWAGAVSTIATLTINHDGRHKVKYSWAALPANQVRIRPDDTCLGWLLYRADWIFQPEPPRISKWDIHFENGWDQYFTGLDLYCDTAGATKRILVEIDGTALVNPATGDAWWDIVATGRQVVHLTLPTVPPLRGHVAHFYATDDHAGLLYDHRWHSAPEPSEQHNWNQPLSILGTQADKWLKAVVFELDSFGQDKTVRVEADGALVTTLTVNTSGRQVRQVAIPQILGRVWRFIPSDGNPSRLYSLRPVFDEEPFQLDRWETQETDHDLGGFQSVIEAQVTLKSTTDVTLTITTHVNQTGTTVTDSYVIPSTGGAKQMRYVPFVARKGVLFKYVFTSADPCWLYQEESHVIVQPFIGGAPVTVRPWGNDDADRTRSMVNTSMAAAVSGGGT